jgi:non-ribosomal peptide synthetase component E (peptide arylation enzyme)
MLRLLAGEAARRFGGRPAIVTGSAVLTFADLDRLSDQVAAGLARRGTRVGDLVALTLPDGPEYVICYLAAGQIMIEWYSPETGSFVPATGDTSITVAGCICWDACPV